MVYTSQPTDLTETYINGNNNNLNGSTNLQSFYKQNKKNNKENKVLAIGHLNNTGNNGNLNTTNSNNSNCFDTNPKIVEEKSGLDSNSYLDENPKDPYSLHWAKKILYENYGMKIRPKKKMINGLEKMKLVKAKPQSRNLMNFIHKSENNNAGYNKHKEYIKEKSHSNNSKRSKRLAIFLILFIEATKEVVTTITTTLYILIERVQEQNHQN